MVFDSEFASEKLNQQVSFDFVNESGIGEKSSVIKNDGRFLWLLLYYSYDYDMTVTLGENASNPTVTNVVKNAFYGTIDRSGIFNRVVETETVKPNYRSVITIKEMDVTCKYYRTGMGFWSYTTDEVKADKSYGKYTINLKLYNQNGEVMLDKDYTKDAVTDFAISTTKYNEVSKMAMKNLIENLTVSSQEIARTMTNDINKALMGNISLTKS